MTLLELATRCEQAIEPDRAIDREIRDTVEPNAGRSWQDHEWASPSYTASLDAAMTLVPEGCAVYSDWLRYAHSEQVAYEADVQLICREATTLGHGEARTPALALCAAALKARAASCDTLPKGGDAQQAPFTSGAVPKADAQNQSSSTKER